MKAGIVGLPNVGKSTLFNCLSNAKAQSANFPFCTIEPNIGVVNVPDARIAKLEELVKPERVQMATVDIVDIAGLVKGASTGEGLGNKFLSHIREVDAICHVVRAWTTLVGSSAPKAAAVIHSDFEKGFIRAEVMTFEDVDRLGSPSKVKEEGKLRLEGKEYIVQDGDVIYFRINA